MRPGLRATVARMKALGLPVSARSRGPAGGGAETRSRGTRRTGAQCLQPERRAAWEPIPQQCRAMRGWRISGAAQWRGAVSNAGASLVDLGDGIGCIELHSLKNAIGGDVLALISSVLKPDSDAVRDFAGFVIASDRENFSVGANLMQLLLAAQEGEWDELAAVIHALPADDGGDQVLPAAGGGGAVWDDAWAAARRSACTRRGGSRMRRLIWAWWRPEWG